MRILLTFWMILALAAPALAQQESGSPLSGLSDAMPGAVASDGRGKEDQAETDGQRESRRDYPGVAEVVPRLASLIETQRRVEQHLGTLSNLTLIKAQIREVRERQKLIDERLEKRGDLDGWNLGRLLENRQILVQQQEHVESILDVLSESLAEMDGIRKEWTEKRQFWKGWEEALNQSRMQFSEEPFRKALGAAESVIASVEQAMKPFVELQEQVTEIRSRNLQALSLIDASLDSRRREVFKRTALPLYSPDYYRQFGEGLWLTVQEGIDEVRWLRRGFVAEQSWVLLLQAIVAVSLPLLIRRYRREAEKAEEWQFVLDHPWATGVFVAFSSLSFLYSYPPALARVFFWTMAAFSASILISGLLRNPRKIFMVYLLAFLFIFSMLLNTIALPLPIYRLYIMLLSLVGAPALWVLAARNLKAHEGKLDRFTVSLRIGAVVLLATCVAQFWGYSRLAMRIVESSIETVFLVLFVMMVMRVGSGGIEFVLYRSYRQRYLFFTRYGAELSRRLKIVFRMVLSAYALIYLLTVWNIFDTVGQVWEKLGETGYSIGGTEINLRMVVFAGLVFYLSIILSWVMQALLDTGVLSRRDVDRGVRDSIKKLLHYSLVLIGFIFALNLAGFALENFVVLAGAFGIGIGFGLQNIVNNFISGIILLFERPVKVGDMVVVDEEWGRVSKIGLRSTIVETLDQAEIIVPNSMFISEKVTNWSLTTSVVRIVVPVGVAYGSDVEKVLKVLVEVCRDHEDVLEDPAPSPIFTGFGDSSLDFELRAWISDVNARLRIRSELGQAVDSRFREEGITIPFPQRDLHLRSMESAFVESAKSFRGGSEPGSPWDSNDPEKSGKTDADREE